MVIWPVALALITKRNECCEKQISQQGDVGGSTHLPSTTKINPFSQTHISTLSLLLRFLTHTTNDLDMMTH